MFKPPQLLWKLKKCGNPKIRLSQCFLNLETFCCANLLRCASRQNKNWNFDWRGQAISCPPCRPGALQRWHVSAKGTNDCFILFSSKFPVCYKCYKDTSRLSRLVKKCFWCCFYPLFKGVWKRTLLRRRSARGNPDISNLSRLVNAQRLGRMIQNWEVSKYFITAQVAHPPLLTRLGTFAHFFEKRQGCCMRCKFR